MIARERITQLLLVHEQAVREEQDVFSQSASFELFCDCVCVCDFQRINEREKEVVSGLALKEKRLPLWTQKASSLSFGSQTAEQSKLCTYQMIRKELA